MTQNIFYAQAEECNTTLTLSYLYPNACRCPPLSKGPLRLSHIHRYRRRLRLHHPPLLGNVSRSLAHPVVLVVGFILPRRCMGSRLEGMLRVKRPMAAARHHCSTRCFARYDPPSPPKGYYILHNPVLQVAIPRDTRMAPLVPSYAV